MAPTKDELEQENAELRDRIAELEQGQPTSAGSRPKPQRPDYLSAGEHNDLAENGVTISPFNGEEINALDEGVEPRNEDAARAARQAQTRARERAAGQPTEKAGPEPAAE